MSVDTNLEIATQLVESAKEAASRAYGPYSGTARGAALMAEDGTVYTGANIEFANFGGSLCAEISALASAVSAGQRKFKAIGVAPTGFPCGYCRQALSEFGMDLEITGFDQDGSCQTLTLKELLPSMFGKGHLG